MSTNQKTANDILQYYLAQLPTMSDYQIQHFEKLARRLESFPASGGGGCHGALLGAANHAVRVGISGEDYVAIMRSVIQGSRYVPNLEIRDAFRLALSDYQQGKQGEITATGQEKWQRYQSRILPDEQKSRLIELRDQLIRDGSGVTAEDIMAASPIMVSRDPVEQFRQVLANCYDPSEIIFAGKAKAAPDPQTNILKTGSLRAAVKLVNQVYPEHIVPNPLTGRQVPQKSCEGQTYRGDAAVADFRFAVVEFDNLPLDDQLAFWSQVDLPITALVFSGGKSVHAWVRLKGIETMEQWDSAVRSELYAKSLIPMGADPACQNPSRLSRMPGHYRKDKGQVQQLLYLAPKGKALTL